MTSDVKWKPGDRIIHRGKPEWGVGAITAAMAATHEGQACQRLTVRFENIGLKTLTTALANLAAAKEGARAAAISHDEPRPEFNTRARLAQALDAGDKAVLDAGHAESGADLRSLPDEATDPFRPLEARLRTTLDLYRFDGRDRNLLTWASASTGLSDPLARHTRHELEVAFNEFEILRDRHLAQLLQQASRNRIDIGLILRQAPPTAQQALQRAHRFR